MKTETKNAFKKLFFIIAVGLFLYLFYNIIDVYFNGFGSDYPITVYYVSPRRYGFNAVCELLKFYFGFSKWGMLGKITVPIYIIALIYIIIYLKSIWNKKGDKNEQT